jgi:hypothetical protein
VPSNNHLNCPLAFYNLFAHNHRPSLQPTLFHTTICFSLNNEIKCQLLSFSDNHCPLQQPSLYTNFLTVISFGHSTQQPPSLLTYLLTKQQSSLTTISNTTWPTHYPSLCSLNCPSTTLPIFNHHYHLSFSKTTGSSLQPV